MMGDREELYATILGVTAPWTVERVEVDVGGGAVHVSRAMRSASPGRSPASRPWSGAAIVRRSPRHYEVI
jgi:hypothetical protein